MRRTLILATSAALTPLTLASSLAASNEAGKTPLRIDVVKAAFYWLGGEATGAGRFSLVGASAADSDSGMFTFNISSARLTKTPNGQSFQPVRHTGTAKGKHGTLVIRSTGRQYAVPFRLGFFGDQNYVLSGTWSIVRGTGRYTRLKGSGGFVATMVRVTHRDSTYDFSYRYEGFVTRS